MRALIVESDGGSRGDPGPAGYGGAETGPVAGSGPAAGTGPGAGTDLAARTGSASGTASACETDSAAGTDPATGSDAGSGRAAGADRGDGTDPTGRAPAGPNPVGTAPAAGSGPVGEETAAVGWGAAADLGPPATFVLLRHGESPLTPEKRFSGSGGTNPSLSPTGREQAERAGQTLASAAYGTIEAVVSSPVRRCRETAEIVAGRLGLPVTVEDGLREADFGAWEGLTFAEAHDRYPEDLDAWLASTDVHPTGGGESFAEVAARVAATRDRLLATHAGRTVLLVTHVTPIKTLAQLALGAPLQSLFRMELSSASFSVIAYYADGNASLRLLNDTGHLR